MQKFTAYYQYQLNGDIIINVWPENPNAMYPEMWHQRFIDYSLNEAKQIIEDKLKQKYNKVKVFWDRQH